MAQKTLSWEAAAVIVQFLGSGHYLNVHLGCCTVAYPEVCSAFLRGLELALIQQSVSDCQRHSRKSFRERKALGKKGLRDCLPVTKREVNILNYFRIGLSFLSFNFLKRRNLELSENLFFFFQFIVSS